MSYIDLHMHSYYSDDGEYSPEELVNLCIKNNIRYFSIADHNSTKGIEEAMKFCQDKDIELIPAVELDCSFQGVNLHVLGYGIDYSSSLFNQVGEDILHQEQKASKKRMELVRSLGIEFSDDVIRRLSKNGVVTGEMIGEAAMLYDKNHNNPLLQSYYKNGSRNDNPYVNFYWDYCAQGKPAYVEIKYMSLVEAITRIEVAGGIPILAHPGNNVKENMDLLSEMIQKGVKGLEVYSSYHSKAQEEFYKDYALANHLLITCGSDFHGRVKPSIAIGSSDCEGREESIIEAIIREINMLKKHA